MPKFDNKEIKVIGVSEVVPVYSREAVITILNKLRAEIEKDAFTDVNNSKFIFVNRVNQIIDKYKAESEG